MYSTYNEGKSVFPKRQIGTLKDKVYKYMTSVSKNVYIDKLDDTVDKYNNAYQSTIKKKICWCKIKHNQTRILTLGKSLFGSVKLTKNPDLEKYRCSGYGIGIWFSLRIFVYRCHYFWSWHEIIWACW